MIEMVYIPTCIDDKCDRGGKIMFDFISRCMSQGYFVSEVMPP